MLDEVVEWPKPAARPKWIPAQEYANLHEALTVRELRYSVGRPGFRTRATTLATTLLNAEVHPPDAVAELDATRRWRVELQL